MLDDLDDSAKNRKVSHVSPISRRRVLMGFVPGATLLAAFLLGIVGLSQTSVDDVSRRVLGLAAPPSGPIPGSASIAVRGSGRGFSPAATLIRCGGVVTFINPLSTPMLVQSTALSPARFAIPLRPGARATVRLTRPGLYHYYNVRTGRVLPPVAGNDVVAPTDGAAIARQGWVAVICTIPGLRLALTVPPGHDLFTPKVIMGVVGGTIVVSNHDSDPHNFVIDPASPSGGAFVVNGTTAEPTQGWQRVLVVQQPGLYHVYCTYHAHVVGMQDGWRIVAPRHDMTDFETRSDVVNRNPMEAWIIVLPANTTL